MLGKKTNVVIVILLFLFTNAINAPASGPKKFR